MTENKRFTIENDIEMKDNWNINKRCYHFGNGFDAKDCCNMLNELQNENKELKQEIEEYSSNKLFKAFLMSLEGMAKKFSNIPRVKNDKKN